MNSSTNERELDAAIKAFSKVLEHRQFILGPEVHELETRLSSLFGWRYAIGCNSGFGAHLLSLIALGIGPDKRVLVPAFGSYAFPGAVLRRRAVPVFMDLTAETFRVGIDILRESMTTNIDAIVFQELFSDIEPWIDVAKVVGAVPVVSVITYSMWAYAERPIDSAGPKLATACLRDQYTLGAYGDAGTIWTNDGVLDHKIRHIRTEDHKSAIHEGYDSGNFHQDSIHAALLLELLDTRIAQAKTRATAIQNMVETLSKAQIDELVVPGIYQGRSSHLVVFAKYRDTLLDFLLSRGIRASALWTVPVHLQPGFKGLGYQKGDFPNAERASAENLVLPLLKQPKEIINLINQIKQFYSSENRTGNW